MNKILICGVGSIGRRHFRVIKRYLPKIKIGIIRTGKGKISEESLKSDIQFQDFDSAIQWDADAAIISSPATFHFEHCHKLIKKNIPLLIEKPLDSDYEDLYKWEELKNKFNVSNVLVGYVLRHDPALIKIKNYLRDGVIGDLVNVQMINGSWLPSWRENTNYKETVSASRFLGGGILLEQSHDINLAIDIFGDLSVKYAIYKVSKKLDIDVDAMANINFLDRSNTPINMHMDFCSKPLIREILIRGSIGSIKWDIIKGELTLKSESENTIIQQFSNDPDNRLLIQFKHFMDVCSGKSKPLVSLDNALKTLKHITKVREYRHEL